MTMLAVARNVLWSGASEAVEVTFMRLALSFAALAFMVAGAQAQFLDHAYNRDTNEDFKLKKITNETRVLGPIVRQRTIYTFDNPFKKLTEASVWFSLDWAAVLSGFGYWYKDEHVPGVLMDKQKAWFIYTAITSRNEDPGIMVQTTPSSYHAQIYPIATGYDLRVELNSVGFLRPGNDQLTVPQPSGGAGVTVPVDMTIKAHDPSLIEKQEQAGYRVNYPRNRPLDLKMYAERNKDGWVYVAGLIQRGSNKEAIKLHGLKNVYWTKPDEGDTSARFFIGRRKGAGTVSVKTTTGKTVVAKTVQPVHANARGTDTAKLWAHQALQQRQWKSRKKVLDFSLQYQIPSTQTALLAVPEQEMKLFRKKEAEWQRQQKEAARRGRSWQENRNQNWGSSGGGDPEIRISMPEAVKAYAILPDGRKIDLRSTGDGFWGGSYDIPADAPEGDYTVKIVGVKADGGTVEKSSSYNVDRTAPTGKFEIKDGTLIVRSEPKLGRVIAVFDDGTEVDLREDEPGVYKLALDGRHIVSIVLYDAAHNRGTIAINE